MFLFNFLKISILRHRNGAQASSLTLHLMLEKKMPFRFALSLLGLCFIDLLSTPAFARVGGQRCPPYCVGTTLYTGAWHHGHGDPGCGYAATPDSPSCGSQLALADRLSYHRFRSADGFYALSFHGAGSRVVDISIGQTFETVHFAIEGHEISFVDTTLPEARTVWLISKDELSIYRGDLRVKLQRVDPL